MDTTTYKTTDITLAAYLRCKKVPMIGIDVEGRKGTFHFDFPPSALLMEYELGNSSVEPIAFSAMIKSLSVTVKRATL